MNFPAAPSATARFPFSYGGVASNHPYLLATPSPSMTTKTPRRGAFVVSFSRSYDEVSFPQPLIFSPLLFFFFLYSKPCSLAVLWTTIFFSAFAANATLNRPWAIEGRRRNERRQRLALTNLRIFSLTTVRLKPACGTRAFSTIWEFIL